MPYGKALSWCYVWESVFILQHRIFINFVARQFPMCVHVSGCPLLMSSFISLLNCCLSFLQVYGFWTFCDPFNQVSSAFLKVSS